MAKDEIQYQENYKKGNVINKNEIKRMIDENIEAIIITMSKRTKYKDGTEGIVIEVRF